MKRPRRHVHPLAGFPKRLTVRSPTPSFVRPPYSNPQVIVLAYKYYKDKAIEMRKQVMEYFNRYELDLE